MADDKIKNKKNFRDNKKFRKSSIPSKTSYGKEKPVKEDDLIRLNKYLSNSGVCSRRDADTLIESGVIKVNGKVVTELGSKIRPTDVVEHDGGKIRNEKMVYLLLNKPKDYITTMDDPQGRKTVMDIVGNACRERIYPVGRLDRNTTGLLLFTNDGELAKRLSHPRYNVKKIYLVELDKKLTGEDMKKIAEGVMIDDEMVKVDAISILTNEKGKKEIGIELHSGKNRVVRRIFENLGYDVIKLDRTYFAGFTKKDLPRGKWRFLDQKEINRMKMGIFQ